MGDGPKVYQSVEDADADSVMDTVTAATNAGFTLQVVDEGHVLCQKPDTMELVDVFPDGSWEYQDVKEDGTMREMSGPNALLLSLYLASDENKDKFEEHAHMGGSEEATTSEESEMTEHTPQPGEEDPTQPAAPEQEEAGEENAGEEGSEEQGG